MHRRRAVLQHDDVDAGAADDGGDAARARERDDQRREDENQEEPERADRRRARIARGSEPIGDPATGADPTRRRAEPPRPTRAGTGRARRAATETAAPERRPERQSRDVHPLRSRLPPGVASGCASRSPYSIGAIIWHLFRLRVGRRRAGTAVHRGAGRQIAGRSPGAAACEAIFAIRPCGASRHLIANARHVFVVVRRVRSRRACAARPSTPTAYACSTPSRRCTAAGPAPASRSCVAKRGIRRRQQDLGIETRRWPSSHHLAVPAEPVRHGRFRDANVVGQRRRSPGR